MIRAAIIPLILCGCAGWQNTANKTISQTFNATKAISVVAEKSFDLRCSSEAEECKKLSIGSSDCEPLKICEVNFRTFNRVIKSIHLAILAARSMIVIGDEQKTSIAVAKAVQLFAELYQLAEKYGIVVWKL